MKVKYIAALAAVSVFGMATLTSCGPKADEPDAAGDVAPDAMSPDAMSPAPDAMSPDAMTPSPEPTP
ncbi:MAG: hypothetical protein DCF15_09620 [Phormidesmis priestleyi]|uniref:Lipoprotein n=1 Tax=Phormidesmis priestleyi TaxID=268141 RepID=A0A2W4XGH9_9CYAN|nr:MAG: hypothetical protein DCF15_09620 [Phormidesmis priestleyi]